MVVMMVVMMSVVVMVVVVVMIMMHVIVWHMSLANFKMNCFLNLDLHCFLNLGHHDSLLHFYLPHTSPSKHPTKNTLDVNSSMVFSLW